MTRPGIQPLKWIPRAPRGERDADEMAAHDDCVGGFSITERGPDGILQPSSESDEYFPVYYVEPLDGNEVAAGFDLVRNPTRLEALEQLRDTGQTVATARTTLVQPFDPLTLGGRIEEILGWGA